ALKQVFTTPEAANRQRASKSPCLDQQPAKIFDGVAEMGKLPVKNSPYSIRSYDEVAVAEIAMHDSHLCAPRNVRRCPLQTELHCGHRVIEAFPYGPIRSNLCRSILLD